MGTGTGYAAGGQAQPGQKPTAMLRAATPGYFKAMGIPLVAGRYFGESDTAGSTPAAIVDTTLVRRTFPDGNAIGKQVWMDANERAAEIVGVVGTVKPVSLDDIDWPTIYLPYAQKPDRTMMAVVRAPGDPSALASAVERTVHEMDPEQPIAAMRPMEALVDEAVSDSRFNAVALGFFGVVAFVLAAVGIYGVISYDVAARTNEIGIRMALGAERAQVMRMILGQGAALAAVGIALGLIAAFALTRFLQSMLFGVDPHDFYTFASIAALLALVALFAAYLPSRRATALDPVNALRHE
jgi:putative ABC transport system permease protein